jgi:hypothetical protein
MPTQPRTRRLLAATMAAGLILGACGDDDEDTDIGEDVEQQVEEGVDDAEEGVEDGSDEAEQQVDEGAEEDDEG